MSHISVGAEYGLHCLLFLVDAPEAGSAPSARDLADLQGVPAEYLAKIFTKLQKAELVVATEGVRGGMRLARAPRDISVLDVVKAIDGDRALFDCREVRGRCLLFEGQSIDWEKQGVCSIHAVMLEADKQMREVLARHSLAEISQRVVAKAPRYAASASEWLLGRGESRRGSDAAALRCNSGAKQ